MTMVCKDDIQMYLHHVQTAQEYFRESRSQYLTKEQKIDKILMANEELTSALKCVSNVGGKDQILRLFDLYSSELIKICENEKIR